MRCPHTLFALMATLMLGCATAQVPQPPPTIEPPTVAPAPTPTPPEPQLDSFLPSDVPLRTAILTYQRTNNAPTIRRGNSVLIPFLDQAVTVRCQQLLATDIELEPGERITTPLLGDSERWKVTTSTSGADTPHLIVKTASDEALTTNLVLTTDRRTYRLTLVGNRGAAHAHVQFYYPRDTLQRFTAARAAHALALERHQRRAQHQDAAATPRNYLYRVQGPDVPWKPQTVFDDGTRVFLLMSPGMRTSTAPVLYVSRHGEHEQVNYSVRDSYYVVENLFDQAVLLTDVGNRQERVTIERQ